MRLYLIALALKGKKVSMEMVDDMVVLCEEQEETKTQPRLLTAALDILKVPRMARPLLQASKSTRRMRPQPLRLQ